MGFVEGAIEEEKVLGGTVFPKVLHPSCTGQRRTCDLAEMVHKERLWLSNLLKWHGALLFRGFEVFSQEDFARVVESFEWEEMGYNPTTSVKVTHRVHTANEASLPHINNFLHEMSLLKEFPSKIFFFCSNPSPEGGEISIVPSHIIVEKMEEMVPDFVRRLSETGSIFRIKTRKGEDSVAIASTTWKRLLQIDDQVESEARVKIACDSVVFKEDGSIEFIYGPMNPIREFGGKRVWFSTILCSTDNKRDLEVSFSDGSPFPVEAVDTYKNILEENCINLRWQKGDILLVDNLSVQCARRPRKKPPSVILVSICK